jgi:type III secretion protein T
MVPNARLLADFFPMLTAPLLALALGSARMFGVLAILPVFTRLGITGLMRGGVAIALALPLWRVLLPAVSAGDPLPALVWLAAKEALIGVLIGVVFSVPFWAAEAAGELLDQQRGSQSAVIGDASGTNRAGITATLLTLTLIAIFFASGGMRFLLDGVYASYRIWPAMQMVPHLGPDGVAPVLGVLDDLLRGGLLLAGPLLTAMLLTEIALGLINRIAPQINVFDMALAVKSLVLSIGLPIYAIFLFAYLRDGLLPLTSIVQQLARLAG